MAPKKRGARKRKNEEAFEEDREEEKTVEKEADRRRKERGNKKYIGAHVSIQGGVWKAVDSCTEMGGSSFALFLGSQRSWKRPALDQTAADKFREQCSLQGYDPAHILPHGSYLMNCGSPKEVLENMSGQGSTVGGTFPELKSIIDRVRDQSRVGVCLDTCHAFAAGYNLSAERGVKAMLKEFDEEVGLHYLKAIHLNDSKGKLGCNLDRHEDIGKGQIGISTFRDIVNEPTLDNIPLILETPGRPGFEYAEQIELLYSLCEKN
ncbi:probable endonuclease 4 isoform X2 [Notolabrus celidotus]|uniref:probable endonuclease 4 isoform X2 n=1 Tax=Notolabrus celidotus TaxID=1203425 RepID=UPI00149033F1|nr:probable endonuclease 4 isoform X2 [Notolabrus celidotus]